MDDWLILGFLGDDALFDHNGFLGDNLGLRAHVVDLADTPKLTGNVLFRLVCHVYK